MLLFVKEKLARIQPRPPAPFLSLQEKRGKGTTRRTRLQVATRNGLADPNPLTARPLLPVGPLSLLLWALPNRTLLSPSLPFPSLPLSLFSPVAGESSGGGATAPAGELFSPGNKGTCGRLFFLSPRLDQRKASCSCSSSSSPNPLLVFLLFPSSITSSFFSTPVKISGWIMEFSRSLLLWSEEIFFLSCNLVKRRSNCCGRNP